MAIGQQLDEGVQQEVIQRLQAGEREVEIAQALDVTWAQVRQQAKRLQAEQAPSNGNAPPTPAAPVEEVPTTRPTMREVEDTPDMMYGRLLEAAHVSSHTFERACAELEWLLTDDRWKQVGPGYRNINAFLRSVDFSAYNMENRPELVRRIKELQPEASNRAIAEAIGVDHETVNRDVRPGADAPVHDNEINEIADQAGADTPVADAPEIDSELEDDEAEWDEEASAPTPGAAPNAPPPTTREGYLPDPLAKIQINLHLLRGDFDGGGLVDLFRQWPPEAWQRFDERLDTIVGLCQQIRTKSLALRAPVGPPAAAETPAEAQP